MKNWTRLTRRGLLLAAAGGAALLAAGCSRRSDVPVVTAALQDAVEAVPGFMRGNMFYQDSTMTGTVIHGVLRLSVQTEQEAAEVLGNMLQAIIGVYAQQPNTRSASVTLEVFPDHDRSIRVRTPDVVTPSSGGTTSTDDLKAHFGVE